VINDNKSKVIYVHYRLIDRNAANCVKATQRLSKRRTVNALINGDVYRQPSTQKDEIWPL